jgi:hypothetical protein
MSNPKDFMEELGDSINTIASIIKKFKGEQNIIMKINLGIFESGKFSPGLHSVDFFDKVKVLLDSNHFWDSKSTEKTTDNISGELTKRGISKFKIDTLSNSIFSYQNTPFDFSVTVSRNSVSTKKMPDTVVTREKLEYSYTISDYKFNLSKILHTEEDSIEEQYEFEIELLNLGNNTTDVYRSHSALLKIRDIINYCETINEAKVVPIDSIQSFGNMTI